MALGLCSQSVHSIKGSGVVIPVNIKKINQANNSNRKQDSFQPKGDKGWLYSEAKCK